LVLYIFSIPVPDTHLFLTATILTSIGSALVFRAFLVMLDVAKEVDRGRSAPISKVLQGVLCAAGGFSLFSAMSILVCHGVGLSVRSGLAVALGASLAGPGFAVISLVPRRWLSVEPLRAMATSVVFMVLLAFVFRNARMSFVAALRDNALLASFVAFNLFADTVSLAETKWVLERARSASGRSIALLLVVDIVASGAIYTILPTIANQDMTQLWRGIQFSGEYPWIGILFWTTFSTSALLYSFALAVLALRPLRPVLRWLDANLLELHTKPVRSIALVVIVLESIAFLLIALLTEP
jgi:hypothetical protein